MFLVSYLQAATKKYVDNGFNKSIVQDSALFDLSDENVRSKELLIKFGLYRSDTSSTTYSYSFDIKINGILYAGSRKAYVTLNPRHTDEKYVLIQIIQFNDGIFVLSGLDAGNGELFYLYIKDVLINQIENIEIVLNPLQSGATANFFDVCLLYN